MRNRCFRSYNDILDFSKIEAGKLEFENVEFDLNEAVDSALSILVLEAQAKGLALRSEIDPAAHTTLCGDPGRLRQVLTNLLNNAVKFTERGEVVLRVLPQKDPSGYLSASVMTKQLCVSKSKTLGSV